MSDAASLGALYRERLRAFIDNPVEAVLADVAKIGRDMVAASIPIEFVIEMHDQLLREMRTGRSIDALVELLDRAPIPLMELVVAHGMAARANADQTVRLAEQLEEQRRILAESNLELEDINERLNQAQKMLVDQARRAGRAEIATGVLHNVGNVLNSVKISVATADREIRDMRIGRLDRAMPLILEGPEKQRSNACAYTVKIVRQLLETQVLLQEEVTRVARHVDQASDIVARQQSIARAGGVVAPVDLAELVKDSAGIALAAAHSASTRVRVIAPTRTTVTTDRSRVEGIVVNLVTNGVEATERHPGANEVRLYVDSERSDGFVAVRVADDGIGIAAENLDTIFRAGFTTREGGTGYGLHASALAAREIGGNLTVESAGPERGATFTLLVPIAWKANHAESEN